MSRSQFVILILTMPFWLGMMMVLWEKNPLFILIPCGVIVVGSLGFAIVLIVAAELCTKDDWDLVIRSILHRLGFNVAAPKSLMTDIDLENPEHWHQHHDDEQHQHNSEKGQ